MASTHLLFFQLELNRLDDDVIARLAAEGPLAHYRPWLEDVRKEKPYELSDETERLFHEKAITGSGAFNRLFDETIAALRFEVRGEALGLEQVLNLLQDRDAALRKAAADAIATTLKQNLRMFGLITNVLAKDKEISDRWRGFADVADSRHLSNRVEPEVVDALVAAVHAAYPRLSHRYYRLKAKWFGKETLDHWDRNAPLPDAETRTFPWAEARDTVLGAYAAFSPKMAAIAKRFFDQNWIDAPVRPGKAPGAFAHPTVPSAHPYVLLNYQGKPRDVMTLAHELGPRRPSGSRRAKRRPDGADAADVGRDRFGLRRNADVQSSACEDDVGRRAPRSARRQSRGHDQYGCAPDRFLYVRAQAASRTARRRADGGSDLRALDERAGREPRPVDPARAGI